MTVVIDTDGDGEPDATFPLKWLVAFIAGLLASSPLSHLLL